MADPPVKGWAKHDARAKEMGFSSWAEWVKVREDELGRKICGAYATSKKAPCGHAAGLRTGHPGEGRCYRHFGNQPRGKDSPHYKHGERVRNRYANLDPKLAEDFHRMVGDPELHELRDEIALTRVRIGQLLADGLGRVAPATLQRDLEAGAAALSEAVLVLDGLEEIQLGGKGKGKPKAKDVAKAVRAVRGALKQVQDRLAPKVREMLALVSEAATETARWAEFYQGVKTLKQLLDTDNRRMEREYGETPTNAELMLVLTEVRQAFDDTLQAIQEGRLPLDRARTFAASRLAQIAGASKVPDEPVDVETAN